jgi:hypothetical protein
MTNALRRLGLATAISLFLPAAAAAQTVLLKGAAPGSAVEIFINNQQASKGVVAADGQVTVTVTGTLPTNDDNRPEMDSRVYVDSCGQVYRVHILNRNMPAPPRADGCERDEIAGVFWVRQRSTVVIDVATEIPTLLLRQGRYDPNAVLKIKRDVPTGLIVFGSGGWGTFKDVNIPGRGTVTDCVGEQSGAAFTLGASMWLKRWLGGEIAYVRPGKADYRGGGVGYDFTYELDVEALTVAGLVGAPLGPVRIYGKGGGTFHRAIASSTQTQSDRTITVDGTDVVIPGGTQIFGVKTQGWSWLAGGGIEGWVTPRFGLFAEVALADVKGPARTGSDVDIDERITSIVGGVRFKLF